MWWVLTDTEAGIVCRFKEGAFNESQHFTPLDDDGVYDVAALPGIVAAMSDWLAENHYEIVFSSPTEIKRRVRKDLGEEIRDARVDAGYTLRDLAKMTGIAFNHISRIEQGQYNVTLDTLALIADALGMQIGLFEE